MTTGVQQTLDGLVDDRPRSALPLAERWDMFVDDNPGLIDEMARTARMLVDAGHHASINRVFEELRERIHTVGDKYTLNNSYRSFAARAVMARHPDLTNADGSAIFETRRSVADR